MWGGSTRLDSLRRLIHVYLHLRQVIEVFAVEGIARISRDVQGFAMTDEAAMRRSGVRGADAG